VIVSNVLLEWVKANSSPLILGIVSSVVAAILVLLGQPIARLFYELLVGRRMFKRLYKMGGSEEIVFVSGNVEEDVKPDFNFKTIIAGPDATAMIEVLGSFRFVYPKKGLRTYFSTEIAERDLKLSLVSIGGPVFNKITRRILTKLDVVGFEDYTLVVKGNNRRYAYEAEEEEDNGTVIRDYGIVLNTWNPLEESSRLILVMGCDTYGVLAAARTVSCVESLKNRVARKVAKKLPLPHKEYLVVVEAEVLGEEVGNVRPVLILCRRKRDGSWTEIKLH